MSHVDTPSPTVLSLCSGIGMLDEAIRLVFEHARTACFAEWEAYAASVLLARIEDESLEPAPVWCGDLRDFDATPFRGLVDILAAGLPCQPYSYAGKREGNTDRRSYGQGDGPIPQFLRITAECRPTVVLLENVPAWLRGGWFRPVGEELSRLGYEIAEPVFVAASDVGASHERERVFVLAHLPGERGKGWRLSKPDGRDDATDVERRGESRMADTSSGDDSGRGLERRMDARPETTEGRRESPANRPDDVCATVADAQDPDRRPGERGEETGTRTHGQRRRRPSGGEPDVGDSNRRGRSTGRATNVARPDQSEPRKPDEQLAESARGGQRELRQSSERQRLADGSDPDLFAPGPSDPRWQSIIANSPHLAPAIEPGLRELASGQSLVVDSERADQLRCCGNQVVALQAACALVELLRRAKLI